MSEVSAGPGSRMRAVLSVPRRGVVGYLRGLGFAFRGARRVYFEEPALARYWVVPVLVTSASLLGSMVLVYLYGGALAQAIWSAPTGDDWLALLARGAHGLLTGLVYLVLAVGALVTTTLVGSVVAAPFNARLGEVLDERVTGHPAPAFALARVLSDLLRTVVLEAIFFVVNTLLFLASLAFAPAAPVLGFLGLVFTAFYFAVAYLEIPLVARDATPGERARFWSTHAMALLGYGTGVAVFLFLPIVNVLFMPAAVAGAVLLFAELGGETRSRADTDA